MYVYIEYFRIYKLNFLQLVIIVLYFSEIYTNFEYIRLHIRSYNLEFLHTKHNSLTQIFNFLHSEKSNTIGPKAVSFE